MIIYQMSWLDRIFHVFSRRNDASPTATHEIPDTFRNRVFLWCRDVFSGRLSRFNSGDNVSTFWGQIHSILQYRHGKFRLSDFAHPPGSEAEDALDFLAHCPGEQFLDFLEDIFRVECYSHVQSFGNSHIEELNRLLQEDKLPYYITDFTVKTTTDGEGQINSVKTESYPKVIMKENELIHDQAIKPSLELLQHSDFSNANAEFLEALEDYRKEDYGDCLTKCGSSFESVLKVLCERKGWRYNPEDTAKPLIRTMLDNTQLESYFESLLMIVATLRNKLSKSHGAGTTQRTVPRHIARYAINATASAILLIVEEAGEE